MADKEFKTLDDLQEYLEGIAIKEISKSMSSKGVKDMKAHERVAVMQEARLMESLLNKRVEEYYSYYTPRYMRDQNWSSDPRNKWPEGRTYQFKRSVRVSAPIDEGGSTSVKVYFDPDTHRSIFGGEPGFVPILLNEGWAWSSGPKNFVGKFYHLAYYHPKDSGWQFVENAIRDYISLRGNAVKGQIEIWKYAKYNGKDIEGHPKRFL